MGQKKIFRILDELSPSEWKLKDLPRKAGALYNLYFNEYGQLVKRKGNSKHNTTSIGAAHKISGLFRFYQQDNTKEMLCAWHENIYKIANASPHGASSIKSGLTSEADTYFETFKDRCYIVNGEENLMKYNMTNVRMVGMTVPTAPTFNANIDGALTVGNYLFRITYVDEDGYESNGGTASAAMAAIADPSDGIKINIPVSGDAKVTKRRIYRTVAEGGRYFYDGEVADNSTTTYDSVISDALIYMKSDLHTDHDTPPDSPDLLCKRRSRMNLGVDEDLYVSKLTNMEYYPVAQYFPTGNAQKITGLSQQLITLPAFTEDSIERLIGTDEDNFEFRNAFSVEGCIAKRSLTNCKNLLAYLGLNGIFYFDGTTSGFFNYELNEYLKANMNYTYAHLSCAAFFDNKYILCYPKGTSTVPNEVVYYDFVTKTHGIYSLSFSCFCKWDKGGDGNQLYAGSNTVGRIYEVFDGLDDDGNAITCYDDVEGIDLGMPDIYKKWYSIYIKVKSTTGTSLRMYYTLDDAAETYVDETLVANTTQWYQVGLGSNGLRARSLAFRPYVSDKYDVSFQGYALVYSEEVAKWAK